MINDNLFKFVFKCFLYKVKQILSGKKKVKELYKEIE